MTEPLSRGPPRPAQSVEAGSRRLRHLPTVLLGILALGGWVMFAVERASGVRSSPRASGRTTIPYLDLEATVRRAWSPDPLGSAPTVSVAVLVRMDELLDEWSRRDLRRQFVVSGWRFSITSDRPRANGPARVIATTMRASPSRTVTWYLVGEPMD